MAFTLKKIHFLFNRYTVIPCQQAQGSDPESQKIEQTGFFDFF